MAFVLRGGTLVEPDVAKRAAYIAEHVGAWSAGWTVWMLAAMSLVWFYAWWGSQLQVGQAFQPDVITHRQSGKPDLRWAATGGVLLAAIGLIFDLTGEGLSVLLLVERAKSLAGHSAAPSDVTAFIDLERTITLLTAGAANALYTLGGVVLTLANPDLPRWVQAAMWGTWLAGLVMTVSAVANYVDGMAVSTAVLFPLLIVWTAWMGVRMTKHE